MSDNIPTIEVATENYNAALSRLRDLDGAVFDAQRGKADAERAAVAILTSAAAGGTLSAADVLKAREAAASAGRDLEVAIAVRQAGQAAVDRAEVALFAAKAGAAHTELASLRSQAAGDAGVVDAAIQAAREALNALAATGRRLGALRSRVRGEMDGLRVATATNSVLKSQHSSVHPKFPALDTIVGHSYDSLSIELRRPATMALTGTEDTRIHRSVASWLDLAR